MLRSLAPVTAVRGNNDTDRGHGSADAVTIFAGGAHPLLHDVKLAVDPIAQSLKVVISGHSHCPAMSGARVFCTSIPAARGPRRFKLPVAVGILEISGKVDRTHRRNQRDASDRSRWLKKIRPRTVRPVFACELHAKRRDTAREWQQELP
jgi:hypothetical protein